MSTPPVDEWPKSLLQQARWFESSPVASWRGRPYDGAVIDKDGRLVIPQHHQP